MREGGGGENFGKMSAKNIIIDAFRKPQKTKDLLLMAGPLRGGRGETGPLRKKITLFSLLELEEEKTRRPLSLWG